MELLWYFVLYSFLGFLLEVGFARAVKHPKRDRKCFLLLPLCPVYGLGALLIRWLSGLWAEPLWVMPAGFVGATAAELGMGLFYRFVLGVDFWDYRNQPMNLRGLICLRFSLCWSALALLLVYGADPLLLPLIGWIPTWLDAPMAAVLLTDGVVSAFALRAAGTTEVLRWYR